METVELLVGTQSSTGDKRELVSFKGEKVTEIRESLENSEFLLTLYRCPGGYRVVAALDLLMQKSPITFVHIVPDTLEGNRALLTEQELTTDWPRLLTAAGIPRCLDQEMLPITLEKRERVTRFAKIMKLVHSTQPLTPRPELRGDATARDTLEK